METIAVVLKQPEQVELNRLALTAPTQDDVVVDVDWSGVSTGTERLLWSGRMPPFPGMGYPLVPGYKSVGRVVEAGPSSELDVGQRVFVPGAKCFGEVRGLFGASASRLVVAAKRVVPIDQQDRRTAAYCWRWPRPPITRSAANGAVRAGLHRRPRRPGAAAGAHFDLGVGERSADGVGDPALAPGAPSVMAVIDPEHDTRRDYKSIYDVSGDATCSNR